MSSKAEEKAMKKIEEREAAREHLKGILPKGSKILVNITHTSRENQSYSATVSVIRNGELIRITREVAKAIEWDIRKDELKGGGYGTNRANDICYAIGWALYRDGYALKFDYV